MGDDRGFAYTVALTHAIEEATGSVARANPEAFRYRGADLRAAVNRSLYIALASHRELMQAYAQGTPAPPLGTWMAERTGATLLSQGARAPRLHPRVLAARCLFAARTVADRLSGRDLAAPADAAGPTCFLLDHPKYLRFIAPVRARLAEPSAVIATDAADGVDLQLDAWPDGQPEARAVGRALWSFPDLVRGFDRVLAALSRMRASRTVVIEGMSPLDEIGSQASRALGVRSICLQQGWSPLIHPGFRGMTHSTMTVWGEGFRDLLEPHNPGVRFAVTGNPVLGVDLGGGRLRAEVAGRRSVAFFLQGTSSWIEDDHLNALHQLVRRTAKELPEAAVLVREHPGAPLDEAERAAISASPNVTLTPGGDFTLRDVLDAADVAVSIYSTSLLEGAALGTPAVIYNPTSLPPLEPDLAGIGAAERVGDVEEAVAAIRAILHDDERRERMRTAGAVVRERYFAGGDSADAALRTAEAIEGREAS